MDDAKLSVPDGLFLTHSAVPEVIITSDTTISQLLTMLKSAGISLSIPCINLNLVSFIELELVAFYSGFNCLTSFLKIDSKNRPATDAPSSGESSSMSSSSGPGSSAYMRATEFLPLPSPLQIFSSRGGLSLLAHYLPTVYPEMPKTSAYYMDKDRSPSGAAGVGSAGAGNEWVKLEVAIEVTRDSILGPIPITQPISTVGMTCIRLRFAQPEIATSVIIRLYRPRDSMNIGLTQISILGTTTFGELAQPGPSGFGGSPMQNWPSCPMVAFNGASGSGGNLKPSNDLCNSVSYRKAFGCRARHIMCRAI